MIQERPDDILRKPNRQALPQRRAGHDLVRKLFALCDPTKPPGVTAATASTVANKAVAPFVRDIWLPETRVMVACDAAGSSQGYYLAVKGGHNDESHNHNDVGHFIIYIGCRLDRL